MTAPGSAPDRAALARAEADWRATPPDLAGWVSLSRDASRALMAEYDRRGAELDRWKTLAEGWHKHHNEALDARDAARAERDQARVELDRQRETLTGCVAENQRLYAERDDLIMENRRIRGEASRMGNELDRQRALIAAVLAECERRESAFSGPAYTEKWVETHRIRALLEGGPAQSPPARCGVGFPIGPLVRGMWVCCLDPGHDGPHRSQQQVEREKR